MPDSNITQGAITGTVIQPTWGTVEANAARKDETNDNFEALINEINLRFANYYTRTQINTKLEDYYKKSETDALLKGKSDTSHTHDDRYYTESETDTKLAAKVNKTGDTMTGNLQMKSATADRSATSLPSQTTDGSIYFRDKNNAIYASVCGVQTTDGSAFLYLDSRKEVNGSQVVFSNHIRIYNDGSRKFITNDSAAWRDGIGAVNKAGDTMSGNLTIEKADSAQLALKTTNGNSWSWIKAYPDVNKSDLGNNLLIQSGQALIIGSGEFPTNAYNADVDTMKSTANENIYIGADGHIRFYTNANTIANRKTWILGTNGATTLPGTLIGTGGLAMRAPSPDRAATGTGGIYQFKATSSMTTNKPSLGDGHILGFEWDTTDGYDSQLYIHNLTGQLMVRGMNGGTWQSWRKILDSGNYTDYAAAKSHTHSYLPLTGGTITGNITASGSGLGFRTKDTRFDYATPPSASIFNSPVAIYDKNAENIGHLEFYETTEKAIGVNVGVRVNVNGTWTWKQCSLLAKTDGTVTYSINTPSSFRSALGLTGIAVKPDYTISTTDLTAGTSALTTNQLYFVYE